MNKFKYSRKNYCNCVYKCYFGTSNKLKFNFILTGGILPASNQKEKHVQNSIGIKYFQ